jgi:hypothetical protein
MLPLSSIMFILIFPAAYTYLTAYYKGYTRVSQLLNTYAGSVVGCILGLLLAASYLGV